MPPRISAHTRRSRLAERSRSATTSRSIRRGGGPTEPAKLAAGAETVAEERGGTSQRRLAIAGMAGNILEWYDFSIYGFFAYAIGQNFFPSHSKSTSLIDAFGVFAAGFLMRPIGALLFGQIGDRLGRKQALTISVVAVSVTKEHIALLA